MALNIKLFCCRNQEVWKSVDRFSQCYTRLWYEARITLPSCIELAFQLKVSLAFWPTSLIISRSNLITMNYKRVSRLFPCTEISLYWIYIVLNFSLLREVQKNHSFFKFARISECWLLCISPCTNIFMPLHCFWIEVIAPIEALSSSAGWTPCRWKVKY